MLKSTTAQIKAVIKHEVDRLDAFIQESANPDHDPVAIMERIKVLNSLLPEPLRVWVEPSDRGAAVATLKLAALHEMVSSEAASEGFGCEKAKPGEVPINCDGYLAYIRGSEVGGQSPYVPVAFSDLDLLKNKEPADLRHLVKSRVRNACLALRGLIGKGPPRAADSALSA